MSESQEVHAPEQREQFEPIESYERLIRQREESPDEFLLRTSEATRRALAWYEKAKARAASNGVSDG